MKFMGDQPRPHVVLGWEPQDEQIRFFVQDNGQGIGQAHQDQIFELFTKIDPNASGTGMGLAAVRQIVEAHNGRIWVESNGQGQGSTFRFTLGLHPE